MIMQMFRTLSLGLIALCLPLVSRVTAEHESHIPLGPYSVILKSPDLWERYPEYEVNHTLYLKHRLKEAAILVSFESLTSYDMELSAGTLMALHEQWLASLRSSMFRFEMKHEEKKKLSANQFKVFFNYGNGKEEYAVTRFYLLFPGSKMAVQATLEEKSEKRDPEMAAILSDLVDHIQEQSGDMLSPCVHAAFLRKRFSQFMRWAKTAGMEGEIPLYRKSYSEEMRKLRLNHPGHGQALRHS